MLLLSQILQFLGVEINSRKNECIPSPGKEGQNYFKGKSVSIKELTQVLVHLSSKAITVLAAPLQFWAIQRQQIAELPNVLELRE